MSGERLSKTQDMLAMAYENLTSEDLILRDRLAIDRTHLANERTLLAYARTAFMLVIAGATAIKALPDDRLIVATGWALLACGLVVALFGAWRFRTIRLRVQRNARTMDQNR
jgi:putative membrane protein